MTTVRIEMIEMPTAIEVRAYAEQQKERIEKMLKEKAIEMDKKATADLPRFIRFINDEIEKAKLEGKSCIHFSFNSERWEKTDPRCIFTFKGTPSRTHTDFIADLYESLGFYGWCHCIECMNNYAYRDGEVYLSWLNAE